MKVKIIADEGRQCQAIRRTGLTIDQLKADFRNILQSQSIKPTRVPASAITEDQLKNVFQDILQAIGTTSLKSSCSTTCSSSLSIGSMFVDEESAGYHSASAEDFQGLRYISEMMNSKGCLEKLISLYTSERKSILYAHFKRLGIEKSSSSDIQRLEVEPLRLRTMRWIRAANVILRFLFAYEKQLSEHIFKGLGNATDETCLIQTLRDPATQLLDFAEALSSCRRSPEKLKIILLLYRSLSALLPDISCVFPSELAKTIHIRVNSILSRLVEAVRLTLSEFEDAVLQEKSTVPAPGGTIHRMTKYVTGYISFISENKDILEEMIVSKPSMVVGESIVPDLERVLELEGPPLTIHVFWIIVTLRLKLEGLSKYYEDAPLAHLFTMNNVHYIVHTIKQSTVLKEMIGDNYLKKLKENIDQATTCYLRATWDRVLDCLRNEGLHVNRIIYSGLSTKGLKKRFKTFNALMQDVQRKQEIWTVPDPELREKLFRSILGKLISSYRAFLQQFGSHIERGNQPQRYIKYSEEQLEVMVRGLFMCHESSSF